MLRDADGRLFFGFCGTRVYVPDGDPRAEGIADGVLRRFRERLAAEIAKDKLVARNKPANDGCASSRERDTWRGARWMKTAAR